MTHQHDPAEQVARDEDVEQVEECVSLEVYVKVDVAITEGHRVFLVYRSYWGYVHQLPGGLTVLRGIDWWRPQLVPQRPLGVHPRTNGEAAHLRDGRKNR